ncbi:MAG: hypothetical protein RLW61_04795 [Gammaproteobacteria bacterium]
MPQAVAGEGEQLTVEEQAPVDHTPPFSPRRHRETMVGAGGFDAVDGNGDGAITRETT